MVLKLKRLSILLAAMLIYSVTKGQQYQIEVKPVQAKLEILPFKGTNPAWIALGANSKYFTKNGMPWFPLMGEMHYNRVPEKQWEEEILKMKNGGLSIVATYIFWNEHETRPGVWDWKANRNLRQFVSLCAKHQMMIWLRIGPWSHGEQLHGGFPDWIQNMKGKRTNNPAYIKQAEALYQQIGLQTKGMYFTDGGPIVGVQLENEYASGQAEHISKLKQLAQQANINPVFWTVTANTVFDDAKMEVMPLQGAYAYRGWERGGGDATKDFLYGNDQWIMTDALGKVYYDVTRFPKGMCEQGAGSQMTYANRFVVKPEDIEAHVQNQIGRGMNLMGYYMFHGGTQTPGLKESGYPESYDFQAPIDEFGFLRASYKYLKILHNFTNDFGTELASMQVFEPTNPVRDEKNTRDLRYVARANASGGFLFLGNTQVRIPMPDKVVKMQVKLPNETITYPEIKLKGQTTAILPFNLKVGSANLKYVTAQPLAKLVNGKNITVFFQQLPNVWPQLAIDESTIKEKTFGAWQVQQKGGVVDLKSNTATDINFTDSDGNNIKLVFLTRKQAENAWRIKIKNQEALLVTEADVIAQSDKITLKQLGSPNFELKVYPKGLNAFAGKAQIGNPENSYDTYLIKTPVFAGKVSLSSSSTQDAEIKLPSTLPINVSGVVLNVNYFGNACKLFQNGKLLTDNLFNGTTWQIGTDRFTKNSPISLHIEDWDGKATGIADDLVKEIKQKGSMFKKINSVPQYQTVIPLFK